jgi:tetratricopeptide (TPR) repeat protein
MDAQAYISSGLEKMGQGNLNGAIEDISKAIDLGLDETMAAGAYGLRGSLRANIGQYDLAIADSSESLSRQLKINDANGIADTYVNRGDLYVEKAEYDLAIADYNESIPRHLKLNNAKAAAHAYAKRGFSYSKRNDIDLSKADLGGRGPAKQKDLRQAIGDYEAALRLDPNDAAIKQMLGGAQKKLENLDDMLKNMGAVMNALEAAKKMGNLQ